MYARKQTARPGGRWEIVADARDSKTGQMPVSLVYGLLAIAALVPVALVPFRPAGGRGGSPRRGGLYW